MHRNVADLFHGPTKLIYASEKAVEGERVTAVPGESIVNIYHHPIPTPLSSNLTGSGRSVLNHSPLKAFTNQSDNFPYTTPFAP